MMDEYLHEEPRVPRTDDEKTAIIHRLKRIEGQVRGIQGMVENDRYCMDILVQISAIHAALKKVGMSLTERHMKHCLKDAIEHGEGDSVIEELVEVLKYTSK